MVRHLGLARYGGRHLLAIKHRRFALQANRDLRYAKRLPSGRAYLRHFKAAYSVANSAARFIRGPH